MENKFLNLSTELAVTKQRVKANEARVDKIEAALERISRRVAAWNGAAIIVAALSPFVVQILIGGQ
jgi:hypothetical protein